MPSRLVAAFFVLCCGVSAQTVCPPTPLHGVCDLVFDIPGSTPDKPIDLQAEFRSPKASTFLARAFWDGGTKWVIRYSPQETGTHNYRLTGTVAGFAGKQGEVTATANPATHPGGLQPADLHHFAWVEGIEYTPALYMGAVVAGFSSLDTARWNALVDDRASQHFNHLAVTLVDQPSAASFRAPEFFRSAEQKIGYANQRGIVVDVAFFGPDMIARLLPSASARRTWFTYALSRLAAYDITWQGIEAWETEPDGRALLNEIGGYLKTLDPYKRLATTRTLSTSAPLMDDGWMKIRSYQGSDDSVASVEQQLYQYPAISNFGKADNSADEFRRNLWNATMDGQYPATSIPNEQSAAAMKAWYEFFVSTRHWELEPFFDVENGRGLALEGVEYVIYVEKPGPVTVTVEKHGYDVEWFDPATGERTKIKDPCKNETCAATPPNSAHDWVLHISREGTKAGMLKSVRFVSREEELKLQDTEGNPEKVPFTIVGGEGQAVSLSKPPSFSVKLTRQSKALQRMTWLWTGEVTTSGSGYRVIGTGADVTFHILENIAADYPAALHVRLYGMNGLGKVYTLDRNLMLIK